MKRSEFLKKLGLGLGAIIAVPKIIAADKPLKKMANENEKPIFLEDLPKGSDGQMLTFNNKSGGLTWVNSSEITLGDKDYPFESSGIGFNSWGEQ